MTSARGSAATPPGFLTEAQCLALVAQLKQYASGGGYTAATIWSAWRANVRWARNQISTSGEVRQTFIQVTRDLRGASRGVFLNETSAVGLVAAARRAERLAQLEPQRTEWEVLSWYPIEPMAMPSLYDAATAGLAASDRAAAATALAQRAAAAGVLSAGYIEVGAHSLAMIDTAGHVRYCPYTTASYSVTVRDPAGQGSGWAGVDWPSWSAIDAPHLTQVALDKCLRSRNPVAIEPGRYTTILEPQAACDFVVGLLADKYPMREACNVGECGDSPHMPFYQSMEKADQGIPGRAKLGERVMDERITISTDPMDPEAGFPPFFPSTFPDGSSEGSRYAPVGGPDFFGANVFHPTTWVKNGVLTGLAYGIDDPHGQQRGQGMPKSGTFRMSVTGPMTSLAEMIATTARGLLVTRLDHIVRLDFYSLLYRGYTRDGLWLIEHGQISRPVKNMMFEASILSALNQVEQLGVPQRAHHPVSGWLAPPRPVIVPPLKIRDFSFVSFTDAV